MATTSTSICNLALIRIGAKTINDIDADNETARTCKRIYDELRDETLAAGPESGWKFTIERKSVAVDSTAPTFDYDYRYRIPANPHCLRVVWVGVGGLELTDWAREGNYIMTSLEDEEVDIIYVKRVDSEADFPPWFIKVLYLNIAYHLTYKFKQRPNFVLQLKQELENETNKAMGVGALESYVEEFNNDWQEEGH